MHPVMAIANVDAVLSSLLEEEESSAVITIEPSVSEEEEGDEAAKKKKNEEEEEIEVEEVKGGGEKEGEREEGESSEAVPSDVPVGDTISTSEPLLPQSKESQAKPTKAIDIESDDNVSVCSERSDLTDRGQKRNAVSPVEKEWKRSRLQEESDSEDEPVQPSCVVVDDLNNSLEIESAVGQLEKEIKTLDYMCRAKEQEWNNILHLRKVKEEMLLRLKRKHQVMIIQDEGVKPPKIPKTMAKPEVVITARAKSNIPQVSITSSMASRSNARPPDKIDIFITNPSKKQIRPPRPILPKPVEDFSGKPVLGEGRQGPIVDVQSIIADYRSRHPEEVPRRGRRMRTSYMSSSMSTLLSQLASERTVSSTDSVPDSTPKRPASNPPPAENNVSFKDVLIQFAKMSQSQSQQQSTRPSSLPPLPQLRATKPTPKPQQSCTSLLQGMLTKASSSMNLPKKVVPSGNAAFSPTLARLLTTSSESHDQQPSSSSAQVTSHSNGSAHPSLSDLLAAKPNGPLNSISITKITNSQARNSTTDELTVESEHEEPDDRLIIDETSSGDENHRPSDIPPQSRVCQGCLQKSAQFVCAGCGSQWYCSRECQVSAWDEHSDSCNV